MRTETEMHDLVVAKVAAHRRRRALLASAGGGVAVVLLLVAVAAGATGSGPEDSVKAGEGDPTSTTEAPTTTEAPAEETSTTSTTAPPTTTTAPPATEPETTTTTAPPATEPETTTTTTAPPGPVFPPELTSLSHGGPAWGVYLAVAPAADDPSLEAAAARARAVGYDAFGIGNDLSCDVDATTTLGLDPEVDWYAVALYFADGATAQQFVDAFEPGVVGIAQVATYCMD